jgi:hypothetical protein
VSGLREEIVNNAEQVLELLQLGEGAISVHLFAVLVQMFISISPIHCFSLSSRK